MGSTGYVYLKYSFERVTFTETGRRRDEKKEVRTISDYSRITRADRFDTISTLDIASLNSDALKIQLMEYRFGERPKPKLPKLKPEPKETVLGTAIFPLRFIGFGTLFDAMVTVKPAGDVRLMMNVAQPNAVPFTVNPFTPYKLRVFVAEASGVPKMDVGSKSDPYVEIWLESDVCKMKTKALQDTLTPQWMEEKEFVLTDLTEALHFRMMDENVNKDREISKGVIDLSSLEVGVPKEFWIDMGRNGKTTGGGKLNVILLIMTWGVPDMNIENFLYSSVDGQIQ